MRKATLAEGLGATNVITLSILHHHLYYHILFTERGGSMNLLQGYVVQGICVMDKVGTMTMVEILFKKTDRIFHMFHIYTLYMRYELSLSSE